MRSDFLEASVFHMKKPVEGRGHLRQTNCDTILVPLHSITTSMQ